MGNQEVRCGKIRRSLVSQMTRIWPQRAIDTGI